MSTRSFRRTVDVGLSIAGTVVVFAGVLFFTDVRFQLGTVLVGVLLIEAGIWKLSHPLMPEARTYHGLRAEVDRFIGLVRRLNGAALHTQDAPVEARDRFERTLAEMHDSIERMGFLAGKSDAEVELDDVLADPEILGTGPAQSSPG